MMLILTLERASLCSEIHENNEDRSLIAVLAVVKIDSLMIFRLNLLLNMSPNHISK